ncbi:retrovirus-related Pol polyprotein from transposon 17.6 [Trichonephila clavipes]|nr:retrovirus-related Pol polyprotein from transposon 17.6 [Trichonephila clavipes]
MGLLEASQAVIDCGQNELVLEDICRDSTAPDAWNLYATRDYALKPHSLTRITVSGYQTRGDINVVLDGSKHLLFEKNIATPSMVSTYRNRKSDVWVTNLQFRNQIIPRGMCIGQAEPLNEGHLCVISDTSGSLDDQQETSESQMNCSLMMSPELSDEQRNKLSKLLRKFSGLFTKTDKSTAAKTNVKHRTFTGDHAPINQRAYRVSPTERRIIHEEVQKMLDEGIVQPSESPFHHPLCSRFIKGFCYLAEPLQSLLKSGVEFHWGPEEVEAFNSLKKALTSDPVLGMYDERASTEIHTDASGYGIGAVLVQIQNNIEKVIAYASRTLTKAEKNYSTTERECLAIVWATNKFRPYIFGKHFTVVTDHHSLCWLMNLKDPSGRLARWALRLQEHDFEVKYKTGKKHSDADALSRNPVEEETETPDKFLAVTTSMNLAMEQKKDQDLAKLKLLSNSSKNEEFRFINGILCRKNFDPDGKLWLPVIPKHLRADILRHFHDAPTAITEDIPLKESYKGPITRSRIKTLEQNDSGALSSFSRGAMPHA